MFFERVGEGIGRRSECVGVHEEHVPTQVGAGAKRYTIYNRGGEGKLRVCNAAAARRQPAAPPLNKTKVALVQHCLGGGGGIPPPPPPPPREREREREKRETQREGRG